MSVEIDPTSTPSYLDIIMSRLDSYEGEAAEDAYALISGAEVVLGHGGHVDDMFLSDMAEELQINLSSLLTVEAE